MSLNEEQAAIQRRQRIAETLMQQGQEPLETNQVAGGYVVPVSPLAGVAKVAQQLAGAYTAKKADESQAELQQKRMDELTSIDLGSQEAPNKLLALGHVSEALAAQKNLKEPKKREGVPTGFTQNEDGSIAPMPIAGGKNYMDYQIELASQKAQIPSYGEPQKLDLSFKADARAEEAARRQEEAAQRQYQQFLKQQELENKKITQNQSSTDLANWRLENPNYEKYQAQISDADAILDKLNKSLDSYKETLKTYSQLDRHNPLANTELQTAYQAATWPLRDESMINTGVLNPGDKAALESALTDPTSFGTKGFRDYNELLKGIDKLKEVAKTNVDAIKKAKSPKTPPPMKAGGTVVGISANATPEDRAVLNDLANQNGVNPTQLKEGEALDPSVHADEDLQFTAQKYGITVDELKKRIGLK